MDYSIAKKIEDTAKGKYEAVIVAAKLARKINALRMAEHEQMDSDETPPKYATKVTIEALNMLSEGKVKYDYIEKTSPDENTFQ
ncbi:MAG: hypothetical protein DRP26_03580 [Candidatus Zixiibacteriota bacterium]|nr:MAG: hypothetical protein DRP26_03580 [candidate division Zixibacteria bacterium]